MRKLFLKILLIHFSSALCFSQTVVSLNDSTNYLLTNFENNVNNALLKTNLKYEKKIKNIYLLFSGNYYSDVTKLNENYAKDMSDLDLSLNYSLKKNAGIGLGVHTKNLSDNRNIELNKKSYDYLYANFDYYPLTGLYVNSKLGYKSDDQIGERNTGFSGSVIGEVQNLNIKDYISNGKLNLMYENLSPKVNHNYEVYTSLLKTFSGKSQNFAEIKAFNNKYESYIPATQSVINEFNTRNNIQARTENYFNAEDRLSYYFTKSLKAVITGLYRTRNVYTEYRYKTNSSSILFDNIYDTKINENYLVASGKLDFDIKNFFSSVNLAYTERSENHNLINSENLLPVQIRDLEKTEKNKNSSSRYTTLFIEAYFRISNTNYLRFYNTSSILKYDTDSKENFDDRDEATFIYSLSHIYDNLRNFSIETTFDMNVSKTQYIFKEKSSNNNKNNIYKLTSRSYFAPCRQLVTKNQIQVLANYTIYDFEDVISQIQSFSFRQLSLRDSINFNLTRRIELEFINDLKFYEQGEFREKEFSVRPLMYYDEKKLSSQISYLFYDFLNLSLGYRYFIQKQYEFNNGEKKLKRTIKSYGPYARLALYLDKYSSINIVASRDITSSNLSSFSNNSDNLFIYVLWYW